MIDLTDIELLEQYVRTRAEDAFAELVRRHLNLVYSVAFRFTGQNQDAQDIAQAVFIILANKARTLRRQTVLTGWLYETTRNTAAHWHRGNVRRQIREQEASMQTSQSDTTDTWQQLEPHLEAAMASISERERTLLALRFYENRTGHEAAAALGIREDAAHKRTARALEKLRKFFTKKGVVQSPAAIASTVSANAVQSAPAGMVGLITKSAITGTGSATAITLVATTKTIAMTTLQKLAVIAALTVTIGAGAYAVKQARGARVEAQKLQAQQAPILEQIQQLRTERDKGSNMIVWLEGELAKNEKNNAELLKLRGEVGLLRNKAGDFSKEQRDVQRQLSNSSKSSPGSDTNAVAMFQIHLKARFLSLPKGNLAEMQSLLISQSSGDAGFSGVLSEDHFTNLLAWIRESQQRYGAETLGEPEITTLSERQTQMRATQIISVITNLALLETNGSVSIVPELDNVETGPILDAAPHILPDGNTIELPVNASVTDFLGYEANSSTMPVYAKNGEQVDVPKVIPQFRVQQNSFKGSMFDNQTLVLKLEDKMAAPNAPLVNSAGEKAETRNNDTLVFVTATIVDRVGSRINKRSRGEEIPIQSQPASN
jgi:RNA polymerase sigma factor (sigma-70 family)